MKTPYHYIFNTSYALYVVLTELGEIAETCLTEFEAQFICSTGKLTVH
jgi:hypothetical protein